MEAARAPHRVIAAVVLVCFGACANTATIGRTDGPDNEAFIDRSDAQALYVRGSNGQIYRLPRRSVGDIDHPGNVLLVVGASLVAALGLILASTPDADRSDFARPLAAIYGIPGAVMMAVGGFSYWRSVQAAAPFAEAATPAQAVPPADVPAPTLIAPPVSPPPARVAPPDAAPPATLAPVTPPDAASPVGG
jgi:hypothetical protein